MTRRVKTASNGHELIAADLFAGGGGLTVGLKKAGFLVAAAVEMERHSCATYAANHPDVLLIERDIRQVDGSDLLEASPTGRIDLLAGCPPCQGFSSLTSKYKRSDPRNSLIREMGRLIVETKPRAVMLENVPGLAAKGRKLLDEFLDLLYEHGYDPIRDILQVADYGVAQLRRRLVLLAGLGFPIQLPLPTHSRTGAGGLSSWRAVREIIAGLPKPITLSEAQANGGAQCNNWHVVRDLSPVNRERIKHARVGRNWSTIPKSLRPHCHKNRNTGFPNVYGRMRWTVPSPTITGGCTTFSKGRFGHPSQNRTISVREAALIQSFPPQYIFQTPYMEHVCNIIGNALPCDFAAIVADSCAEALSGWDE